MSKKPNKICPKCSKVKNLNDFCNNRSSRDGKCCYCSECKKSKDMPYYVKNKGKLELRRISRVYKLSEKEYYALLFSQNEVCAICKKPEVGKSNNGVEVKKLSIDHNHTTGKVRGLLCHKCNVTVGFIKESPELAIALANYLILHKE